MCTSAWCARKSWREKYFPLALTDRGISFKCQEGNAFVDDDKLKILAEVGDKATTLNQMIHGVVGIGALERVLKSNSKRRHHYLESTMKSTPPRQVCVDKKTSTASAEQQLLSADC